MSTIREIEEAIQRLSPQDLTSFREWFAEFDARAWDRQWADDAASGRLDALAAEALDDAAKGRATDL